MISVISEVATCSYCVVYACDLARFVLFDGKKGKFLTRKKIDTREILDIAIRSTSKFECRHVTVVEA